MKTFLYTSKGPRPNNQDSVLVSEIDGVGLLLCVADGVGGNNGGEVASKTAVDSFYDQIVDGETSMEAAVEDVHKKIRSISDSHPELSGMATTFTAALIKEDELHGVHCGDSRLYVLRGNGLKQLSQDHSEVARYIREGKLTKEEALVYPRKNIIYSALGSQRELVIDSFDFSLRKKDRIMLLTDGVSNFISKKTIRDLSVATDDVSELGNNILSCINNSNVNDNYTFVIAEF